MSAAIMEAQLVRLVNSDPTSSRRSCTATRLRNGGVAINQNGHHRGIWTWTGSSFAFTPGGYAEPTADVMTTADAVIYTQRTFASGA